MTDASGSRLGQEVRALERVGIYVPGGRAAYPSTVLMTAVPARVAGVPEIVLVSPPGPDGTLNAAVLAAARVAGVTEAYRVGGAQAVAALAYGTASIRRVDKIVGPGNIYVALAKRRVFGDVGIDMLAGPSEVVVIADAAADPAFAAADLLAQAEHDPMARAVLLSPSAALLDSVEAETLRRLETLPRREIAASALEANGALVLTASLEEAVDVANRLAPEHLELLVAEPDALLARVRSAGAVFLGGATPEVVGDYVAGPNHVLPTGGTARFASRALHRGLHEAAERDPLYRPRPRGSLAPPGRAGPRGRSRRPRGSGARAHRDEGRHGMTDKARGTEPAIPRQARVERKTKETQIVLQLGLDGTGASKVETAIPFFNHMLEAWSKHGLMDLSVDARGDLEVDLHHTVEDVGICLGKALKEALGDKRGIVRYGASFLPMDEALLHAAVDLSGRPFLVFNVPLQRTRISNFDLDLLKDFFRAFAFNAEITLHVTMHYGENLHHIAEATFKAVGRALAEATRLNPRVSDVPSTKGSL